MDDEPIPEPGQWPIDPQEDQPILEDRIWIDGCFDFFHHGHANVLLQSRALGQSLYIGVHSDAAILHNKGPTVMTLAERLLSVSSSRWSTLAIPSAPYVTSLAWISHYGCKYVVHGDDITSDAGGEDCYRFVKEAGRFKVVKRTPGISTTDLVGRMLREGQGKGEHFLGEKGLRGVLQGGESMPRTSAKDEVDGRDVVEERLRAYASDETGLAAGVEVYFCDEDEETNTNTKITEGKGRGKGYRFDAFIDGKKPQRGQRVVYVDGTWDLFSSGHIAFLREVVRIEEEKARRQPGGWKEEYSPCYVVVGIHDDLVVNAVKGGNYPIMNVYERSLCVLQCKYINALILSAPLHPGSPYLHSLPHGPPSQVYHGSTNFMSSSPPNPTSTSTLSPNSTSTDNHTTDNYADAKALGIFSQVGLHEFQDVDAAQIVGRILARREEFEERQRRKEGKGVVEEEVKRREG